MHGQHREDKQQKWHMWPGPLQRSLAAVEIDSAQANCFSKAGRTISVGDCALFQAENAPPFIGIIRKLIPSKEGNWKLSVNWLYRLGELKLGKGASVEAAPNEIFYSFHKDEISAAYLLHPCKVAFLQKGIELPPGVSSFVCWRVFDATNKCLYWLTDQDYTDEHQTEIDQLLDKTKHEMQTSSHSQGTSQKASSVSASLKGDAANNALLNQARSKKRERDRSDQNVDPSKNVKLSKVEDIDSRRESVLQYEDFAALVEKEKGLVNASSAEQLVQVMVQERGDSSRKMADAVSRRTLLASVIAATEKEECLTQLVQHGCLPVLDDWLQEAHKGKSGDGSPREGDKGLEELLLTLLRALDKLPVDLDALKTCMVGKSVNNLKSHKNNEIQRRARKLVDTWKKRVNAEMKSSDEGKPGVNNTASWPSKPSSENHNMKGRPGKNTAAVKLSSNGCPSIGDGKCNASSIPGSATSKDNTTKLHVSSSNDVLVTVKEEKNSSSGQSHNNNQLWCNNTGKGIGSSSKDEVKMPSAALAGNKSAGTILRNQNHGHSNKNQTAVFPTGPQKDASGRHKASVIDKTSSTPVEKGVLDGTRAEISNNQRLILRLPNPARSPGHSASGCSLVDGTVVNNRSSPESTDKHDSINISNRVPVHSPDTSGDGKCGNNSKSNGGKSKAYSKEEMFRSDVATLEDVPCKSTSVDEKPRKHVDLKEPSDEQIEKLSTVSKIMATPSPNRSPERHHVNNIEAGIDLLASIATCEGSEPAVDSEAPTHDADLVRESEIQGHISSEPVYKNGEQEDGEKLKLEEPINGSAVRNATSVGRSTSQQDAERIHPQAVSNMEDLCEPISTGDVGESVTSTAMEAMIPTTNYHEEINDKAELLRTEDDNEKENLSKSSMVTDDINSPIKVLHAITATSDKESSSEKNLEGAQLTASFVLTRMAEPSARIDVHAIISDQVEDALELARQVANEVKQQVEELNKAVVQDAISDSHSEDDSKSERSVGDIKGDLIAQDSTDATMGDVEVEKSVSNAPHTEDSIEINVKVQAGHDETSATERDILQHVMEKEDIRSDPGVASKHCSDLKDKNNSDTPATPKETASPVMQAADVSAVEESTASLGDKDMDRPVFDLNEGFTTEEAVHEEIGVCTEIPSTSSPCHQTAGVVTPPVAVVSATKGAFIPPSDLVRTDGGQGWKGSAATSAFRPAEPRRTVETWQTSLDGNATPITSDSGQSRKQARPLNIDLNIADEIVTEDVTIVAVEHAGHLPGASLNEISNGNNVSLALRPELDLNRMDESDERLGPVSGTANLPPESTPARVILDFDLNDGPMLEEVVVKEVKHQHEIADSSNTSAFVGMRHNPDLINASAWYSSANSMPATVRIPASSSIRQESLYPVVSTAKAKHISSSGQNIGPLTGALYQGGAANPTGVSYTTIPPPFSYASFPYGSGFPLTSASYNVTSPLHATSVSPLSFPTSGPPQLVTPGAAVSPYARPYLFGNIGGGQGVEANAVWQRPNLDLNAGPDVCIDADARDGLNAKVSVGPSQFSYTQTGSVGGTMKRKEPESGFDPYKSGFKQMTWQ